MAMQTASLAAPSVQVVGNAFVDQYYHILHNSPESVFRFYHDSSVVSRPDSNGVMSSVTTMKGINDKICSLDYKNYKAEIKTADAQESYKDGVIVLVTGCLTGKDNLRKEFTQTFFLAPQDKGYFVLNDVFRYVEETEQLEPNTIFDVQVDGIYKTHSISQSLDPEPEHVPVPPMLEQKVSHAEEVQIVEEKVHDALENEVEVANERNIVVDSQPRTMKNHVSLVTESASSTAQEDTPKKSYASIVSSQMKRGNAVPTKVYVPTNTSRVTPTKTEKQSVRSAVQTPVPEPSDSDGPGSTNVPETTIPEDEAEGHSIYIRNLPLNVMVAQLEEEFKKFGPIKQGGIQVRSNKQQGFCFGFVEFEDLSSMQSAIQASPISIGDRKAVVEIKRTTTRVGNGRGGRFTSGRGGFRGEHGGFRGDSFRNRGNFGGGRGYGSRVEFSGRSRGSGGRWGEGYHQGRGRGGVWQGGSSQNAVAS